MVDKLSFPEEDSGDSNEERAISISPTINKGNGIQPLVA
jgi:hypothetical protein